MMQSPLSTSKAERSSQWVDYLLIIVMLACASISVVQFIQRIYTGWEGSYVVFLVIAISIERLLTFRKTQAFETEQKIVYHAAEFITYAILLKLLGYFLRGFASFLDDLSRWQTDFLTFITGEYFLVLILLFSSWLLSGKCAEYLEELHVDPLDVNWDVGILENRRQLARSAMITLILSVGIGMVFAAILTRLDVTAIFGASPILQLPVVNILAYFLAAFLFFSQTQLVLLNGRWMWHEVEVMPGLEKSWFRAGAFFLLTVAILSFILPTSYTVNFLDLLRIFFTVTAQILLFIFSLFFLPIGWLFSLLRGTPPTGEMPSPPDLTSLAPPATPQQVPPFLLFLQSVLFWGVFIGLIALSLSIYLRQNSFKVSFGKVGFLTRFRSWIAALISWLGQARMSASSTIRQIQARIKPNLRTRLPNLPKLESLSGNQTPRQDVIRGFVRLVELVEKEGIVRKPDQTASQFAQALQASIPASCDEIQSITDTFQIARYSNREINRETSSAFTILRKRVAKSLEELKTSKKK